MSPWTKSNALVRGPYLALVLSEKSYHRAMRSMGVPMAQRGPWIENDQSDATTHILKNGSRSACLVAMRLPPGMTGIEIAGLLVHEATHVFQQWCDDAGERKPSPEFEAYSIQTISQNLMQSYADQTIGAKT